MKTKIKINKIGYVSLLIFFLLLLHFSFAWAKTLTVDQGRSIRSAIILAKPGDTVLVKAGTYSLDRVIDMKDGVDLISDNKATIKGRVIGKNAKFIGFNVEDSALTEPLFEGSGTEVRGNSFTASSSLDNYIAVDLSGGKFINNTVSVTCSGINAVAVNAGGAFCANNDIKISGGTGIKGASTAINNIIEASTRISESSNVGYNLYVSESVGHEGSNLEGPRNLGIDAADPTYELYAKGVRSIGTYPDTAGVIMDGDIIQAEINKATAGDTVYIEPGTYTLTSDLMITKNITLTTINPTKPDETVIDLNGNCISIMDTRYYKGMRRYSTLGFENSLGVKNLDNVIIEGLTIKGDSSGAESIVINDIDPETGYGIKRCFTNSNIKAPIFNFAETLTLNNCKILSKNEAGDSIYTWLYTTVNGSGDVKIFYETDEKLNVDISSSGREKLLATSPTPTPKYVPGPYGGPYGVKPESERPKSIISGILSRFLPAEQPAVEESVVEEEPAEEPVVEEEPTEEPVAEEEPVVEEAAPVAEETQGPYGGAYGEEGPYGKKEGPYGQISPTLEESRAGTIQGYIHYTNGYPVMGMKVVLTSDTPYGHYVTKTDNKGHYVITGVERYYDNELIEYTMGVYRPDTNGLLYQRDEPVLFTSETIVVDIRDIPIRR